MDIVTLLGPKAPSRARRALGGPKGPQPSTGARRKASDQKVIENRPPKVGILVVYPISKFSKSKIGTKIGTKDILGAKGPQQGLQGPQPSTGARGKGA